MPIVWTRFGNSLLALKKPETRWKCADEAYRSGIPKTLCIEGTEVE